MLRVGGLVADVVDRVEVAGDSGTRQRALSSLLGGDYASATGTAVIRLGPAGKWWSMPTVTRLLLERTVGVGRAVRGHARPAEAIRWHRCLKA